MPKRSGLPTERYAGVWKINDVLNCLLTGGYAYSTDSQVQIKTAVTLQVTAINNYLANVVINLLSYI